MSYNINHMRHQNILLLIIALVILYSIYSSTVHKDYLKRDFEFTICNVYKYSGFGGDEDYLEYKYYVNGLKFIGKKRRNYEIVSLGKFYKVKYSKVKTEVSEMYLSEEITDSAEIVRAGFKYK